MLKPRTKKRLQIKKKNRGRTCWPAVGGDLWYTHYADYLEEAEWRRAEAASGGIKGDGERWRIMKHAEKQSYGEVAEETKRQAKHECPIKLVE